MGVDGGLADDVREEEGEAEFVDGGDACRRGMYFILYVASACRYNKQNTRLAMYLSTSFSLRILPVWSSHTPLTAFRKRSPSVARSMASAPPPSLPAPRVPPLRGKAGTILSWASRSRCSTTSVLTPLYSWSPSTRGQRGNDAQGGNDARLKRTRLYA